MCGLMNMNININSRAQIVHLVKKKRPSASRFDFSCEPSSGCVQTFNDPIYDLYHVHANCILDFWITVQPDDGSHEKPNGVNEVFLINELFVLDC